MFKWIFRAFLLCVLYFALYGVWQSWTFLNKAPGSVNEELVFEVKKGMGFGSVAQSLEGQGLISSSYKFKFLSRITKQDKLVKVGEYALNRGMLPREILEKIILGKSIQYPITFQEGINMYEIAAALGTQGFLNENKFLELCKNKRLIQKFLGASAPSLEGYLFPDTYQLTKYSTEGELIEKMVTRFHAVYKKLSNPRTTLNLSRQKLVTLASMVEKETGAPEERSIIASVFYNRIRKGMRLQSDPTILYGIMDRDGVWKKNISKKDLMTYTRYNTYKVNGIPYGPIANPGEESLRAIFKPAQSSYLYFVSRNDGTHKFSKTFKEHDRAVTRFQLNKKARQGKSWRDLKKKLKN